MPRAAWRCPVGIATQDPVLRQKFVGQGRHFEIWSAAGWQAQQDAIFAVGDKLLPPGLENLAL